MRPRVVLFQNQVVAPNSMKIIGLRKWYYEFRDIQIPPLVYSVSPEALVIETYAKLAGLDFQQRLNSLQNKRKDEEHGSFPFMLYQNEFVPRESLITFILEQVDIDSRLEPGKLERIKLLGWLLIYRLKQALVGLETNNQRYIENQENLENSQFTSSLFFHPVTAMSYFFKTLVHQEAMETNLGYTHRVDAESAISQILSKLCSELEDKALFSSQQPRVDGLCSLDILAFAFLKQMLTNFPKSSVVSAVLNQLKIVKQFPTLCHFVKTMDAILNSGQTIEGVKFAGRQEQLASRLYLKPRIIVKNSVISKIHNSERFKIGVKKQETKDVIKKRKVIWLTSLSVFSLLTYYNFLRASS